MGLGDGVGRCLVVLPCSQEIKIVACETATPPPGGQLQAQKHKQAQENIEHCRGQASLNC